MLPIIVGAAVLVTGVATATYKYFSPSSKEKSPPEKPWRFAVWGRPNAGKTTFIYRLRGKPLGHLDKEATSSKKAFCDIPPISVDGKEIKIDEIVDMPVTADRFNDWQKLVETHECIFYIFNLARKNDKDYLTKVKSDLTTTVATLKSLKSAKRLNIIASHVDKSVFAKISPAEVNNVIQDDNEFRHLFELLNGAAGYIYTANLIDKDSFRNLLESIVRDNKS